VTDSHQLDQQRLAFGRAAELYDRARPSYPEPVMDALVDRMSLRTGDRILEVGCGTGKATVMLAARGLRVVGLDPDREMTAVARRNGAGHMAAEIIEIDFERYQPVEPFPALISVQAWHWVADDVRYRKAAEVIRPGGILAALWMFPDWPRCSLRPALRRAYQTAVPELEADFPMHPDSQPDRLAGDWKQEIEHSTGFAEPVVTLDRHALEYSAQQYAELLQTHQDHILLGSDKRDALLLAVTEVIERHGGRFTLPLDVWSCTARRV
jgi:SAM-dependent methyltransferase